MNNRLYVGNLSYQTSEQTLEQLFAQEGQVAEAKPRRSATPRRESYLGGPSSYRW